LKVAISPAQFVREAGLLSNSGLFIKKLGKTAVIIGGHTSRDIVEGTLRKSLSEQGITLMQSFWYGGESSTTNIDSKIKD
jgi:glycerol dehydrogenase